MGRLQNIENALVTINDAVFQELCDNFIILKHNNYKSVSREGSQAGKQKTIVGTPDFWLLLPNGKYILAEYSTNIKKKIPKLEEDIKKCLDPNKTGIPLREIAEIIVCTNFKIKPQEKKKLDNLLLGTKIGLTVYQLSALALELSLWHRKLAQEYLGIPIGTGQIVSIDRFIDEYNRVPIATPLNNTFLHRKNELENLKDLISKENMVILFGSPGVGKTKLAIETMKAFSEDNRSYEAFCVSYKEAELLEDLQQNLSPEKDYILFIDDANRIDIFGQIIGFYKTQRTGNLKLLITIRDYAFGDLENMCQDFSPALYRINKFSDTQITDIIKEEPFNIQDTRGHREIIRIADGNPRLAIMAALLAKREQDIGALYDASGLFEKYFSTFIKDNRAFEDTNNIKILGIIAFFYTIPYKDKGVVIPILENFNIDYDTFICCIEQLERLELIEVQYEYAKISEQNLAIYFFYKAFIKDKLLSFEIILKKYFDNNVTRFIDTVIPANNTFGCQNVMEKLQPAFKMYLDMIMDNKKRCLVLLTTFWFYLEDEALVFIYGIINSIPEHEFAGDAIGNDAKNLEHKSDELINLLGYLLRSPNNLEKVLKLLFEYIRKLPSKLPQLVSKIGEVMAFDSEESVYGFPRQLMLLKLLISGLNKNEWHYTKAFFELSKTFLAFKYRSAKSVRNHSAILYEYLLPYNTCIKDFRKDIWENVDENFSDDAFGLLWHYTKIGYGINKEIMEYDLQFIIKIIENHLVSENFEHCWYVQEQIKLCEREKIDHPIFCYLRSKYTNALFEMFMKLSLNRLGDKDWYAFDDYREYEKLKEAEIRNYFVFSNISEIRIFVKNLVYLSRFKENGGICTWINVLDIIVDENYNKNFELGCQLLVEIIENDVIVYTPEIVFRNHLVAKEKVDYIWNLLQSKKFKDKFVWEISFYRNISDELISTKYISEIKRSIISARCGYTINYYGLQKFTSVDHKFFEDLLRIIVIRNANNDNIRLWSGFFDDCFEELGDDLELIKRVYIEQVKIQENIDYRKKGLLKILIKEPRFLIRYVKELCLNDFNESHHGWRYGLGVIWQIIDIEPTLSTVFDLFSDEKPSLWISAHFCNLFFNGLQTTTKVRAKQFLLDYGKKNYKQPDKINIIVDVARHSMTEVYDDILLQFLSLTQDIELFSKIWWVGNGDVVYGSNLLGNVEASKWEKVFSIIKRSSLGIKLIPIEQYIKFQIESALKYAEREKKRRFIGRQ